MTRLTYEATREALLEVSREHPDHVQQECMNFSVEGQVCCLAATALFTKLLPKIEYYEAVALGIHGGITAETTIDRLAEAGYIEGYEDNAVRLLTEAQMYADGELSWGSAVDQAITFMEEDR